MNLLASQIITSEFIFQIFAIELFIVQVKDMKDIWFFHVIYNLLSYLSNII